MFKARLYVLLLFVSFQFLTNLLAFEVEAKNLPEFKLLTSNESRGYELRGRISSLDVKPIVLVGVLKELGMNFFASSVETKYFSEVLDYSLDSFYLVFSKTQPSTLEFMVISLRKQSKSGRLYVQFIPADKKEVDISSFSNVEVYRSTLDVRDKSSLKHDTFPLSVCAGRDKNDVIFISTFTDINDINSLRLNISVYDLFKDYKTVRIDLSEDAQNTLLLSEYVLKTLVFGNDKKNKDSLIKELRDLYFSSFHFDTGFYYGDVKLKRFQDVLYPIINSNSSSSFNCSFLFGRTKQ